MASKNPWLSPLERGYQQIKDKLVSKLLALKDAKGQPLITDTSEGNILVLILSLFSGIAEVIHVYIDNMARESFFSSARRYDSLVKHGRLVDYHPKAAIAALCDVVFTRPLTDSKNPLTIPKGLIFNDSNGNPWISQAEVIMPANVSQATVPFVQHQLLTGIISGTVIKDSSNRYVAPLRNLESGKYEHLGAVQVKVDGVAYNVVETFAYSKSTDKHFIIESTQEGGLQMVFGDGVFGSHPATNKLVLGNAYITQGEQGNIEPASITGAYENCSYSNLAGGGGSNYETFDDLKNRIPLSVKTLGVAVTKQDYVDLAKQIAEVSQVALEYICGRKLNLYISAVGGGQPTGLTTKVKDYLKLHSPMNTWLNVQFAGQSKMVLNLNVVGKPSYKQDDIYNSIVSALSAAYPLDGPIGGKVRLSDIYALIDNLAPVDYLHILQFYVMPWPKVIFGNAQLKVTNLAISSTNGSAKYIVEFIDSSTFRILPYENITTYSSNKEASYQNFKGTIGQDVNVNYPEGFNFNIQLDGKGFQEGYKYEFTISDTNMDYDQPGYNIPVFDVNNLTLNITETT